MWFFKRRKRREAEIKALREELFVKAEEVGKEAEKLNKLLREKEIGTTELIFLATGGDKRRGKR